MQPLGFNKRHIDYHHCAHAVAERRRLLGQMLVEQNHNPNAVYALISGLSAVGTIDAYIAFHSFKIYLLPGPLLFYKTFLALLQTNPAILIAEAGGMALIAVASFARDQYLNSEFTVVRLTRSIIARGAQASELVPFLAMHSIAIPGQPILLPGIDETTGFFSRCTVLQVACKAERYDIARLLVVCGANPHLNTLHANEDQKTELSRIYEANLWTSIRHYVHYYLTNFLVSDVVNIVMEYMPQFPDNDPLLALRDQIITGVQQRHIAAFTSGDYLMRSGSTTPTSAQTDGVEMRPMNGQADGRSPEAIECSRLVAPLALEMQTRITEYHLASPGWFYHILSYITRGYCTWGAICTDAELGLANRIIADLNLIQQGSLYQLSKLRSQFLKLKRQYDSNQLGKVRGYWLRDLLKEINAMLSSCEQMAPDAFDPDLMQTDELIQVKEELNAVTEQLNAVTQERDRYRDDMEKIVEEQVQKKYQCLLETVDKQQQEIKTSNETAAKAEANAALALRLIAEMTGQAAAPVLPLSQSRHSLVGSRPVDENAHREEKKEAPSSRAVSHG